MNRFFFHFWSRRRLIRDTEGRELPDLAAAHRRVVDGGWPLAEDLVERPWGLTDFRVLDPAGYFLRITDRPNN